MPHQEHQCDQSQLFDIDPDVNFFNEINHHVSNTCNYFLEDTFATKLDNYISDRCSHHFSICDHIIRNVKKNLDKLETHVLKIAEKNTTLTSLNRIKVI